VGFATGEELRRLVGHADGVVWAEFSPGDKTALTGSNDSTARLWYTDYRDDMTYLCGKLLRDFTADERAAYETKETQPTCPKP
jgi:WD40 repeat protein